MGKREYGVLFTCNQWKEHSTMRLVGVFTLPALRKEIRKGIKNRYFEFENKIDIRDMNFYELDNGLEYGSIETITINEPL